MTIEKVTTALGIVEIELRGSGAPVLIVPGSPGGIDGAIAMSRFLDGHNFEAICISRPGYLGTPLDATRHSFNDEADLLAAVLEALDRPIVGVLTWSGGGPATYRLAIRHPERVSSIVSIAAVSHRIVLPKPGLADRLLFETAIGEHLVARIADKKPRHIVETSLKHEGSLRGEELQAHVDAIMKCPEQVRLVQEMAKTMNIGGEREAGYRNDERNFAQIESLGLEQVHCPVLLVHGDSDTDAIPEHSRFAHRQMPYSALVEMKGGSHLSFYVHPDAEKVQEEARTWLRQYSQAVSSIGAASRMNAGD